MSDDPMLMQKGAPVRDHFEVEQRARVGGMDDDFHAEITGMRTLLGKPTRCVGRDREIAMLESLFRECREEHVAQAVLVSASAGMGKSRVGYEFIHRVRERGDSVTIWTSRGDSLRAGSVFGLLGQAIRGAAGIHVNEPIEAQREKLRARVALSVPAADHDHTAELLGEIIGAPFLDERSPTLRAARKDAELMAEQMRRAWETFLRAECAVRPVMLVLEDLHWGDLPTVRLLNAALDTLRREPWMVVALARPGVHALFPNLWEERGVQEIRLKELTPQACAELVQKALGDEVSAEAVERLVGHADGNAFYLEELIRAEASRRGGALPESVLAMVQARLEVFDGESRRVLGAASVFGETFWQSGVEALLGGSIRATETGDRLEALIKREVLVRRKGSRFADESELAFRHALLRQGAYALQTKDERALGHRLAAEWLEARGENDATALAEHCERAGESERAGRYYLRAAEEANRVGDIDGVMDRSERGFLCGVSSPLGTSLLSMLCQASMKLLDWSVAAGCGAELLRMATPGSSPWVTGAIAMLRHALHTRKLAELIKTADLVQKVEPLPDALNTVLEVLSDCTYHLQLHCRLDHAEACFLRLSALAEPIAGRDAVARGWLRLTDSHRQAWTREDPFAGLRRAEEARASFTGAGLASLASLAQVFIGVSARLLGALERAASELQGAMTAGEKLSSVSSTPAFNLTCLLADTGALDEASHEAAHMIEVGRERNLPLHEGLGRWARAYVLERAGDLGAAEREALAAIDILSGSPLDRLGARATLASILRKGGRAREALALSTEVIRTYEEPGSVFGYWGAFASLVHAEALDASGDRAGARAAITTTRDRLLVNAEKIGDPELRASFLRRVPENARTIDLANAWLG